MTFEMHTNEIGGKVWITKDRFTIFGIDCDGCKLWRLASFIIDGVDGVDLI